MHDSPGANATKYTPLKLYAGTRDRTATIDGAAGRLSAGGRLSALEVLRMDTRLQDTLARLGTIGVAVFIILGFSTVGTWAAGRSSDGAPATQTANGVVYVNGGIGEASQRAMRRDAPNWPLRMTFSESATNDYVADVKLEVQNDAGKDILTLDDVGPITYIRLRPGAYRISAEHHGKLQVRSISVGLGTEVNFHWKS